ncbi:MAG: FimB/Mfa2 family fimbrial subunit [Prevotella sp.]|nr:FimB/Mfa2 family fimbrial subunit [Prevotella sp.]
MKKLILCGICMVLLIAFSACEKPIVDSDPSAAEEDELVDVSFKITHFDQVPFEDAYTETRAGSNVGEACTRINLAVFSDGSKVKTINQLSTEENFGTMTVSLQPGTYTIVIIAHSGEGNATITSPEEIKFANNKVTDTFSYVETINVEDSQNREVVLQRVVAKFQLCTTDNVPEGVSELTFKYTGGSSTLNGQTGYGCVNSRQTETRVVTSEMKGKPGVFDIYSFPHAETDELKITITATDAEGNQLLEKVFENVPIKKNQITRYTGEFFGDSQPAESGNFKLSVENEWSGTEEYEF